MASSEVGQWIKPPEINRRRGDIPQAVLAYYADITEAALSSVLAGRSGMSEKAQLRIDRALGFFEWMQSRYSPVPINFRDVEALKPFWKEYLKLSSASEVVRTKEEE